MAGTTTPTPRTREGHPLRAGFVAMALLVATFLLPVLGCGSPTLKPTAARPYPELLSHDPAVQLRGIHRAQTRRDPRAIDLLIDLLESDDSWIRFSAHAALLAIVDAPPAPFDYLGPQGERTSAISAWRRWNSQY